jgi:signal transduction histidine kinase
VFQASARLREGFVWLGVISLATSFVLALGMSKSIAKPVQFLIRATERIARGNLSEPVNIETTDEIKLLAQSFDDMRKKLSLSLDGIHRYSVELEERVWQRTRQLEEKQRAVTTLLKKLITSQEDERKRIARELHDESLQTLSATLMNVEMCRLHPELITNEKVTMIRDTVSRVINEMNKVIQNLRPTVLDDLGFEAAIAWLVERNLRDKGIHCRLNMIELQEEKLPPELQTALFRIIQETTANIARHAQASNAFIHIKTDEKNFSMIIEDDGIGFDISFVFANTLTGRGLGILGMKERASQMGGALKVCSRPDEGTMVLCTVPLPSTEGK